MSTPGTELDVTPHGVAVGGDAVARDLDGRVVFVAGALPGESVRVRVRAAKTRFVHAEVVEVLEAAPDRVDPACPHVAEGCGGCGWAHVDPATQRRLKAEMVAEALARIGHLDEVPVVEPGPTLAPSGFRTTVRAAVTGGRTGYHKAASSDRLAVDSCRVAHPLAEELLVDGRFGDADEVVIRVGARTGERMVRVDPRADDVHVPDDVVVVGADELAGGRRAWIHEEVAGVQLRTSADSFFQSRPDGADALVAAVADAIAGLDRSSTLADLYCGVGLFAATVGRDWRTVAVERSRSAVADARVNLAGTGAKVIGAGVERWRPSPAGAVVADPPRSGLGRQGVAKVAATGAERLVLVSCDAGSLGRDAGLLVGQGWTLERVRLVDLFVDTPHIEVVSTFTR